jgi:hypothetical protein
MQQGAVEVIHYPEKREKHISFPVLFRKGLRLPRASPVVIKFSRHSKTAFALSFQFFHKPGDLGVRFSVTLPFDDFVEFVVRHFGFLYVR